MVKTGILPVLLILVSICFMLLVLAGLAFLVVALLTQLFARVSGWTELAKLYAADVLPTGKKHTQQTVQFGAVRYRHCVTVGIDSLGLWLWVQPHLTRFRPLFIPWDKIKGTQETRLYSRKAMQLAIEGPSATTITVYTELFEEMSPYLSPDL
jgi:hypothetical protein